MTLEMRDPKRVSVIRRPVPLFLLVFLFLLFVSCNGFGLLVNSDNRMGLFGISTASVLLALLASLRDCWVHVEYTDADGQPAHAYFTDASALGWGKILGGPERMRDIIRRMLASAPAPDHHITAHPGPRREIDDGPKDILRICTHCGRPTRFRERDRGRVQECSSCGAYLDVPAVGEIDDLPEDEDET